MLERLSDPARRAVDLAGTEARRLGHPHIGTEHLLLGLLAEGSSGAAATLVAAGARLDGARDKVAEAVGPQDGDAGSGDLPYTARAARALERASRLSLQRRDEHVGTEHVLISVLDIEGRAGQVLRRLGVDIAGLRDSVDLDTGDGRMAAPASPDRDSASARSGSPGDRAAGGPAPARSAPARERAAAGSASARSGPGRGQAEAGSGAPRTAPPRCPDCRAALDVSLAYRVVAGRGRGDTRRFVIAFCSACGTSLGATPE